jgi:Ni/Fe-hydrogenase subunit HybB-like protein
MSVAEIAYSRLSYAVVTILATNYWPKLVKQEQGWGTPLLVVAGFAMTIFFSSKLKKIEPGECDATKSALSMVFDLLSILLAFFLVLLVSDLLEEDIGNEPSLRSFFKIILLMLAVALAIALASIPGLFLSKVAKKSK